MNEKKDEDLEIVSIGSKEMSDRKRKVIGWNYQDIYNRKENENTLKHSHDMELPLDIELPSDDIEVLEILNPESTVKVTKRPIVPPSSSRAEIKRIQRQAIQSSIPNFFKQKPAINNKMANDKKRRNSNEHCVNEKLTKFKKKNSNKETVKCDTEITNDSITNKSSVNQDLYNNSSEKSIAGANIDGKNLTTASSNSNCFVLNKNLNEISVTSNSLSDHATKTDRFKLPEDISITPEFSRNMLDKFLSKWKEVKRFDREDYVIMDRLVKHYSACHVTYRTSKVFLIALDKAISKLNVKTLSLNEKIYPSITELIRKLKVYKNVAYSEKEDDPDSWLRKKRSESSANDEQLSAEEMKTQRKLERIEKEMLKIKEKIDELETAEVDFDDEQNSSYLLLEKYKSQFVKLDDMYCRVGEFKNSVGRPTDKKFKYEGSRYPEIDKRITVWVNKKREFPDYFDILKLVKAVVNKDGLPLRPEGIRVKAQEIFSDVGTELKRRRWKDDLFGMYAYGGEDEVTQRDPADYQDKLNEQLKENEKIAKDRLNETFRHYEELEMKQKYEESKKSDETAENSDKTDENLDKNAENSDKNDENLGKKDEDLNKNDELFDKLINDESLGTDYGSLDKIINDKNENIKSKTKDRNTNGHKMVCIPVDVLKDFTDNAVKLGSIDNCIEIESEIMSTANKNEVFNHSSAKNTNFSSKNDSTSTINDSESQDSDIEEILKPIEETVEDSSDEDTANEGNNDQEDDMSMQSDDSILVCEISDTVDSSDEAEEIEPECSPEIVDLD